MPRRYIFWEKISNSFKFPLILISRFYYLTKLFDKDKLHKCYCLHSLNGHYPYPLLLLALISEILQSYLSALNKWPYNTSHPRIGYVVLTICQIQQWPHAIYPVHTYYYHNRNGLHNELLPTFVPVHLCLFATCPLLFRPH